MAFSCKLNWFGILRSVEKVFAALDHEEPDVLPVAEGFSTQAALEHFLHLGSTYDPCTSAQRSQDLEKLLVVHRWWDSDIAGVGVNLPMLASETLVRSTNYVITRFGYGGIQFYRVDPHFKKNIHLPVKYPEDLERIPVPELDDFGPKIRALDKEIRWWKERDFFVEAFHHDPFVMSWRFLRGLTQLCKDIVGNPSFAEKIVEFVMKPQLDLTETIIDETDVHCVRIGGDLGTNKGPMFSPSSYEKIFYPWEKRLVETYHNKGVKVFRHCHGNIGLIFDDLVNAGYDSIDPFEPTENMSIEEKKEQYGDKITLRGGISKYIGVWSPKRIKEHVSSVIRAAAPEGGYILMSAGGVPKEMPWDNVLYYRRLINEYKKKDVYLHL